VRALAAAPRRGAVVGRLVAAAAALSVAGCATAERAPELQRFEFRHVVMAIEARLVLYARDEATAGAAARAAFGELDALDARFSDYRDDSELRQLGARSEGGPVTVVPDSQLMGAVLSLAHDFKLQTDGAFDISVGPLTSLWRAARSAGAPPSPQAIAEARERVGHWSYTVLPEFVAGRRVTLGAGTRFDVGGIAKGYALGWALGACARDGAPAALLELGGDLAAGDPPPHAAGWNVQVPGSSGRAPRRLCVARCAVAVSGDAEQFLDAQGVRYSHVVDPRTGWAVSSGRQALAIVPLPEGGLPAWAAAGAKADALATSACLVEPSRVPALGRHFGATSLVVDDPAFTSLFDGATLAGWTPRGGHYDGDAVWTVEDGCLTGRTGPGDAGGLLYTATPHTSFEFQCECRLEYPFDSGVFVRMAPDGRGAQLTLDDRPDGEVGGLYSDGWIEHARPEAAQAWRRGEWNHVFVRCTGFDLRLEAWINGVPVMDRVVPQDFGADGQPVFAPRGLVGLQVHGGGLEGAGHKVQVRNIAVRDLPVLGEAWAQDRALAPPERAARAAAREAEGWRDLLGPSADGQPLAAWQAVDGEDDPHAPADYRVVDGVLEIPSAPPAGYLRTREDFGDFTLRLKFQPARMANSGLFLRGRRESVAADGARVSGGNPAYSGCEIQMLDDWNWEAVTGSTLQNWQFTGSLYGAVAPAQAGLLAPIGDWNLLEVLARGSRLACALNGQTVFDVDTAALAVEPPFAARARTGFIGLQRYAAPDVEGDVAVRVREMFVKP